MRPETPAMQTFFGNVRGEVRWRHGEGAPRLQGAAGCHTAPHPQQMLKIKPCGGCGEWVQGICCIDPCADFSGLCESGEQRQCYGGPARALWSNELAHSTDGQTSMEEIIKRVNTRGHYGAYDFGGWRQSRRDSACQRGFD
ncbi:MAG: hypothetical protein NVSMB62_06250 [Acidobacteriaceae bacterium]